MYRPEWFPQENIMTIALHVRMFTVGSYQTSMEDNLQNVRALEYVLDRWTESPHEEDKEFDDAVKKVVEIALKEWKKFQGITVNKLLEGESNG